MFAFNDNEPPTTVKKKAKKLKSISLLNGGILEYVENNKSPRLTNTQSSLKNLIVMSQQQNMPSPKGAVYLIS